VEGDSNLRTALEKALKEKVRSLPTDEVRKAIEAHISLLRKKLVDRNFSRLVSARLTYREIKYLEAFLETPKKNGFGMDIDKYLAGKN
jgi:hypothetical protein